MNVVVTTGPDHGKEVQLGGWPVVIGRDATCDLVLTDPYVSGRHAEVRVTAQGLVEITDLGSINGTWVDGVRVARTAEVGPGRAIVVGQTTLCSDRADGTLVLPVMSSATAVTSPTPAVPQPASASAPASAAPFIAPGSRVDAGPVAGGNIDMAGQNVAGRDMHVHEGFRIRSRMRPAARKVLWTGIFLFFLGLAVSFAAVAAFNNEIFSADVNAESGIPSDITTAFAVAIGGAGVNLLGIILIIVSLLMRREKVEEAVIRRR